MILFIIELLRLDGSRRRLLLCIQTEHSMFVQSDLSGIESTSKSISRIECDRTLAIDKDLHHWHGCRVRRGRDGGWSANERMRDEEKEQRVRQKSVGEESKKTWQLIRDLPPEMRRNLVTLKGIFLIYRFQIYEYSQQMDDSVEKEISCDVTLKVIDMILLNETSLNKPTVRKTIINFVEGLTDCFVFYFFSFHSRRKQQVKKLQDLVQLVTINRESTSFVLPVSSAANPKSISSSASISPMRQLKSLQIFKSNVKTLPFSYQIYG